MKVKQLGHNVIKVKLKCHESGLDQHPLSKKQLKFDSQQHAYR